MDGQADQELLSLLVDNLDDNFHLLVMAYSPQLYRFALHYLRDPYDTEDVIQAVMINVYQALQRYSDEKKILSLSLRPWLFAITRNQCFRSMQVARRSQQLVPLGEVAEEVEDNVNESPESFAEGKERLDEISEGLARLPLHYREILILRYFHDLSIVDIAKILNKPLNTVKSSMHRGRMLLRTLLAEDSLSGRSETRRL